MKTLRPLLVAATLAAVVALPGIASQAHAQQPASPAENEGPNASIARWAEGEYAYLEAATGAQRGFERFRLTVHPDGSRTLLMWHDLTARNAQFTVMLRTEPSFRPLEASVSYWNAGQYKGFASLMVDGETLHLSSSGSYGTVEQEVAVPEQFSIGSHPISGDGWHLWLEEPGQDPARFEAKVLGLDEWPDVPKGDLPWKEALCAELGVPLEGFWPRLRNQVRTFADLRPELVAAVERLIDFVAV